MDRIFDLLYKFYAAFLASRNLSYIATSTIEILENNGVVSSAGCNAIEFYNQGNVSFYINNVLLITPGMSHSINQYHPDIKDFTNYQIRYDVNLTPAVAVARGAAALDRQCVVTKVFVEKKLAD